MNTASDIRSAIRTAREQCRLEGSTALDVLLRSWPEPALRAALWQHAGVQMITAPTDGQPDFGRLPPERAREWGCAVVALKDGAERLLAMEDPWDEALSRRVSSLIGQQLVPAAASRTALDHWLKGSEATKPTLLPGVAKQASATVVEGDGPVVRFVDAAVRAAFHDGASDVHFECDRGGVTVKHRLDGVMTTFARMEGQADEVISRIKVLAQLDITERRLPQDGRFRFPVDQDATIDLRVSIMPSVFGEDAVLRLLDKAQLRSRSEAISLDMLGFDELHATRIRELAAAPSGMLLVTGPTGSGKTTTVYAALSEINNGHEKIITIEDPVEYELPGVLQIPVNERKGLTFAKGLRSILRHDPDRILVGEIRDAETAEIAVQSALTGHLVFTTVHANGLGDIVGRFRHFGLDMFGFMSSLNGVVVQRLVRRVCAHCIQRRPITDREQEWFARAGHAEHVSDVPVAVGCELCHGTGYHGRFVLAEVHWIDDGFRDRVTEGASLSALKEYAFSKGVQTLSAQAAEQVLAGRTTVEEIRRVVGWT
jgi:general secretion pathway protein E